MFNLPKQTFVNKVIPKYYFENKMSVAKKKLFTDTITKIRLINRLSTSTTLLPITIFKEIDIIEIELRRKTNIENLLEVITRMIPNYVIYIIKLDNSIQIAALANHPHPSLPDTSVKDWTFIKKWDSKENCDIKIELIKNLNEVFFSVCNQLSHFPNASNSLEDLIQKEAKYKELSNKLGTLKKDFNACQQFNKKVELYNKVKLLKDELRLLLGQQKEKALPIKEK